MNPLRYAMRQYLRGFQSGPRSTSKARPRSRPAVERLEDRVVPTSRTFSLNDPNWSTLQVGLNNLGQTGGKYGVDIDMPAAWSITTGSMTTVVAVIGDGVDYTNPDIYLNMWLNQGEIPAGIRANLTDVDGDGLITFRDLNAAANSAYVSDLNGNGYIDGGDLLKDPRWADGIDQDGNGKVDDLIGWDFQDNDNDPMPGATGGHDTGQAQHIGGTPNNGIADAGVDWKISMMPVRVETDVNTVNYTAAAAGLDYAVAEGAPISNNSGWGSSTYSQVAYDAINRAKAAGHLFVAAAGNYGRDIDVTPVYPAAFDLDNIISVTGFDSYGNLHVNHDWGHVSVDLAAPSEVGTSWATCNTTGVAALLKTIHPDWNYVQIKNRILSTVEQVPEFAGITVTGGRLNAAFALATTSIAIDNPSITEGDTGTSQVTFTLTRVGDNSGDVTVHWSTADGTAAAGSDYVAVSGNVTFAAGGSNTQTFTVDIKGDTTPEFSENFYIDLSLVSGSALLADSDGQATIVDNDTKFYVVDDGTTDKNYQYSITGTAGEAPANINSGNTAPRGEAAIAAGTTLWVVDNNKTVYVYDSGTNRLLGSWSAGGLSSSATLTGIATNGTDIWLVDSYADKVYKYTGAASLRSGSQTAASSFSLVKGKNGNPNPQDIVTDGTSFWIVDGTSLKVFKYSLSGSSLGSWTIDSANKNPTGITINPNNVSDIWIVDSGTKKVYKYAGAATRTSGSQSAASSFALAANNTNPQGIADPPTAGDLLPSAPAASVALLPVMQPAPLVPATTNRDAFFDLVGNAPSTGSVNQTTQRPTERNVVAILPPSPEAAPIMAARSDAVFADSQQAADDVVIDMAMVADEDVSVAVE
jgi:hypothetical protein